MTFKSGQVDLVEQVALSLTHFPSQQWNSPLAQTLMTHSFIVVAQLKSGQTIDPVGQVWTVGHKYSLTAHSPPGQMTSLFLQTPVLPGVILSALVLLANNLFNLLFYDNKRAVLLLLIFKSLHSTAHEPSSHLA